MSKAGANRLHPKRWTALTWLAVVLWAWRPFALNFPPSESYTVNPVTGALSDPIQYDSLSELPFPVGWPLYYVKPSYLNAPAAPVAPVGTPMPLPPPSTVHPFAMVVNLTLVVTAISSLVYFLQTIRYRYSLLFLLGVMAAVPLYFGLGRLTALLAGHEATQWYSIAVYFSPVPAALAVRFAIFPRGDWRRFRSRWQHGQETFDRYINADDAIAAASRLEMSGEWNASMDLYRRAADRWPEHATYVQHCIDRVVEKQSLAQSPSA